MVFGPLALWFQMQCFATLSRSTLTNSLIINATHLQSVESELFCRFKPCSQHVRGLHRWTSNNGRGQRQCLTRFLWSSIYTKQLSCADITLLLLSRQSTMITEAINIFLFHRDINLPDFQQTNEPFSIFFHLKLF